MSDNPDIVDNVQDVALSDTLGDRYLSYALSTIMSRSLPDVRDGLKPVHRRLLFAMRHLKLNPETGFKKCARVVGDVIGKYHPHGDQSVYDAMVRLAQEFAVRYPLVDGQGNFGNIDGDNAAAMRYTEARMTAVATALMEGLDQDAVDFRETYDGEEEEPVVMPANFPNLLANGSSGIAVGMATNIPPHNVGELCTALLHLIKFPNAHMEKLVSFINGPDFPTGGTIVESRESIIKSYETGRGSFRLRAKWSVEETGRGMYQVIVTEIPYQVQKSKLIERIADLMFQKKLPMLADILDESSEDIRIVLEPRARTVEPEVLMESLFRLTDLETRISLNMNVLEGGQLPRVMSLREVLQAFLDHRQVVLVRRSKYRLGKIEHRLEVLGGYLIAYLNLDEVIRIIRFEDEVKSSLMGTFKLTETQAEAILNMRLRSLRKLEEVEIRTEFTALEAEKSGLLELLGSEDLRWDTIAGEIKEIRKKFGSKTVLGARRSLFADAPVIDIIPVEAMIEKEPITVICSEKGWVRGLKGHVAIDDKIKYKEGDGYKFGFTAYTTDKVILVGSNGRFYTLGCDKLPGGRGHGEPVRLMIDLPNEDEIVALFVHQPGKKIMLASIAGRGFILDANNVIASTKNGKQIMNVEDGQNKVAVCYIIDAAHDTVAIIGTNRKMLVFPLDQMAQMNRGRGAILQKYKGAHMGDITSFNKEDGLSWPMKGERTRTETDLITWIGRRGAVGRMPPHGFPTTNRFS
ncbi:MAG: DNA topoisomerase IV subunit A [Emcibacter sp.]|nr:DNA topoisomerase IV subunit A [Emcibacter sp.]